MFDKTFPYKNENPTQIKILLGLITMVIYLYVIETSQFLGSFYDEFVSLTSNYSFFTNLDFDASSAKDIMGNYSAKLSSGPLSATGSVIGWHFTKNLLISRVSNFVWLSLLLFILVNYVIKYFSLQRGVFLVYSLLIVVIHPWWYGTLYSLGEAITSVLLIFGFIVFSKNRVFSLLLISFAIIYGKYINVLSFSFFYLFIFLKEKSFKNLLNDFFFFSLPFLTWFALVEINHEGGLGVWLEDLYKYYITTNQSIDINNSLNFSIESVSNKLMNSEIQKWNLADFLRVLIMPAMSIALLFFKNIFENKELRSIVNPIIFSSIPIYVWFWLSSPSKWIRYSQSFILINLFVIVFCLAYKRNLTFIEIIYSSLIISLFMSSNIIFLLFYFLFILLIITFFKKINTYNVNLFLIVFLTLSILNSFYEVSQKNPEYPDMKNCEIKLNTELCYETYIKS